MAYTKQTWIDNNLSFPVSAARMNHIEDGIASAGFTVDVWNSQANPASVTDWGPIVNALISGGSRYLGFGQHIFPFSTQITNQGKQNVIFQGAGGWLHPWYRAAGGGPDRPNTQLVWKGGAGSGNAIVLDRDGHILRDLAVLYDTAAYNGTLVRFSSPTNQCARSAIERGYVGSLGDGTGFTAATGVDVTNGVGIRIVQSLFNGMKDAYVCRLGAVLSDDMIMDSCTFQCCSGSFIKNIPRSGSFKNIVFYGQSFVGTGTQPDDFIVGDSSSTLSTPSECSFADIFIWDLMGPSTGTYPRLFNQPANQDWRLSIRDVFSFNKLRYIFAGPGSLDMDNVSISGTWGAGDAAVVPIDLGNPATAFKTYLRIKNLKGTINQDGPRPVQNIAGHANINIDPFYNSGVRFIPHREMVSYDATPNTSANNHPYPLIAATGANVSLAGIQGNDAVGIIEIQVTGAGQVAGLLADITFSEPAISPRFSGTGNASLDGNLRVSYPSVLISPCEIVGLSTAGESAKCGIYARITGGTITGFKIGCVNNIPASAKLAFAYRVVQL